MEGYFIRRENFTRSWAKLILKRVRENLKLEEDSNEPCRQPGNTYLAFKSAIITDMSKQQ